ncbi:MAG TPA: hypothetical protein VHE81_01485 [Lacipirellulaceae bacterium]|nr:hypothetical protein [Lacipirellulaceae bacterium]
MCAHDSKSLVHRLLPFVAIRPMTAISVIAGIVLTYSSARGEVVDPLANGATEPLTFAMPQTRAVAPAPEITVADVPSHDQPADVRPALYQPNDQSPFGDDQNKPSEANTSPIEAAKNPCAAVPNKPLNQLGINISQPAGKMPTDLATACWEQINQDAGQCAGRRCWPLFCYQWDATCFCHQPLYFEEANLERYGYGCDCCLQPAASAFHFFGTIPVLPYCMVAECPGDCVYTLGHYRPGDCNPWRWLWPSCDPLAATAYGGFWVGMVAAFP